METCTTDSRHVYFTKSNPGIQHYKSASDGDSPDASMPMGNLASPLVDSGYREGSVTYNHEESTNSYGSLTDEGPVGTGPPTITPVSGQLEKFKQNRMIRPVPLKAASPSRSLDSPCSTSSRHSLPSSPASMPDHTSDNPHQQQQQHQQRQQPPQQQHQRHQPPDVVLTNQQKHGFAGNHFGGLPTKCLSLQDITPKQRNYHDSGPRGPSYTDSKAWGKQPAQPRRIQPAHSLNYLNRTVQNLQNHKLLPDYKRRNISQSSSQVDNCRSGNNNNGSRGSPKKPVRVNHTNPSYGHVMDYNSNRLDGKSSMSSSSQVSSVLEETEMDEVAALRQKVLEKEAQLNTLRDTMDNNEAAILKVHEEKHRTWSEETSWLRKELLEQEDTSRKIRHSLQAQIYKLEQEKKTLREKVDVSHHPPSKEVEDLKWQLRNFKEQLGIKTQEIANLRNKLTYQEQRLSQRAKTVASLEAELERLKQEMQRTGEKTPEAHRRLLQEKEAELSEARIETNHLRELKENLAQEVKVQEEELTLLRTKIGTKDQELSQERCEVAYLREVQEKLNQQLQKKGKSGGLLSGKGNHTSNVNLKEKLAQREKEVTHVKEQLRKVQDDKEQEVGKLRQNMKERNGEIEKLQKKLSEAEKDRSMLRNKLANGKGVGGAKMTPLQRQLESDFMDIQVKLTTREREVFQLKRELVLLQEKNANDIGNLKAQLSQQEQEQQDVQDRMLQRETEIGFLMDKTKSQENEITMLKEELEKSELHNKAKDTPDNQQRVDELERKVAALMDERSELHAQVADLREESAMYKDKLDKISFGVRTLSTSQSNLINLTKGGSQGATNSGSPGGDEEEKLREEISSLREKLADSRKKVQSQEAAIGRERRVWQEEKEKVIKYQKQLQLNYVQMCRRNRSLESDLQQLTMELEHKEISHC